MSNAETLNQYIKGLFDYWDGKNDDFEPIPIPKEGCEGTFVEQWRVCLFIQQCNHAENERD